MEQETQKNIENKLPTKTKIAAVWLIGFGIISTLIVITDETFTESYLLFVFQFILLIWSCLFYIVPVFLIKKKKWSWWLLIIILFILTIIFVRETFILVLAPFFTPNERFVEELVFTILFFIPLILLLRDRKNFFKVAS